MMSMVASGQQQRMSRDATSHWTRLDWDCVLPPLRWTKSSEHVSWRTLWVPFAYHEKFQGEPKREILFCRCNVPVVQVCLTERTKSSCPS